MGFHESLQIPHVDQGWERHLGSHSPHYPVKSSTSHFLALPFKAITAASLLSLFSTKEKETHAFAHTFALDFKKDSTAPHPVHLSFFMCTHIHPCSGQGRSALFSFPTCIKAAICLLRQSMEAGLPALEI